MRKQRPARVRLLEVTGAFLVVVTTSGPAVLASTLPSAFAGSPADNSPADTIQVPSTPLEAASLGFAQAMVRGSAPEITSLLVAEGIRLQLDGPAHAGISARQAVASLRGFLRGFDRSQALLSRASPVDGSPDRGFAEVFWSARASGTSDEIRRTLFLGLSREQGSWRVDEVRVLR